MSVCSFAKSRTSPANTTAPTSASTVLSASRIKTDFEVGEGLAPPVLKLLPFGECIKEQINNLEIRYENVKIDNYVIMPNHIHILMRIENQTGGASPSPTVSDIICAFKSLSTLECKKLLPIDILFQRSYHDHIIRDDIDYQQIWQYIDENPTKWAEDKYNTNI